MPLADDLGKPSSLNSEKIVFSEQNTAEPGKVKKEISKYFLSEPPTEMFISQRIFIESLAKNNFAIGGPKIRRL